MKQWREKFILRGRGTKKRCNFARQKFMVSTKDPAHVILSEAKDLSRPSPPGWRKVLRCAQDDKIGEQLEIDFPMRKGTR